MSIRIRSNGSRSNLSSAISPFSASVIVCPAFSSIPIATRWLTTLSSASRILSTRARVWATGAAMTGFDAVAAERFEDRVGTERVCRTGLIRYDAMPSSRQRAESCGSPDEVSIMIVGAGVLGIFGEMSRHGEAVHVGHVRVEQHELERFAPPLGLAHGVERGGAAVDERRPHASISRASFRKCGGWSRCRRRPAPPCR